MEATGRLLVYFGYDSTTSSRLCESRGLELQILRLAENGRPLLVSSAIRDRATPEAVAVAAAATLFSGTDSALEYVPRTVQTLLDKKG